MTTANRKSRASVKTVTPLKRAAAVGHGSDVAEPHVLATAIAGDRACIGHNAGLGVVDNAVVAMRLGVPGRAVKR
jgi:hypothetical protein